MIGVVFGLAVVTGVLMVGAGIAEIDGEDAATEVVVVAVVVVVDASALEGNGDETSPFSKVGSS